MRQLFILKVFIVISAFGYGQGKVLTLKQCVDTAIANNLEVKQSDLRMQASEINWKQSKSNLLPSLNGNVNHGINQGRSIDPFSNAYIDQKLNFAGYGLNAGVPLFRGLSLQNNIKKNSLSYQASKMDLRQAKDELTLNVILAYLQVLTNNDLLVQARNQLDVSKKQVDRLQLMNEQGAISPSLLSDLQGEQAGNELAVINSENSVESSKLALFQLMNINYDEDLQVEQLSADVLPLDYALTVDSIYKSATENLGIVKAATLRQQSADKAVKEAKGGLYPTLSLNGNLNTNYSSAAFQNIFLNKTDITSENYVVVDGVKTPVINPTSNYNSTKIPYNKQLNNNLYTTVSLDLNIPLFNSFAARNKIKLAALDEKSTDYIAQTTKIQLRQTIEQAFVNMNAARNRYKTTTAQVKAFTESFRAAEVRFNAGVGTVVDYIIAKNNVDQAKSNLIIARYDYMLRSKVLDFYQGKPLW